jgi:hypothetical protein
VVVVALVVVEAVAEAVVVGVVVEVWVRIPSLVGIAPTETGKIMAIRACRLFT